MPVDIRKPLGLLGLNLGVDPAQAVSSLVVADGARYDVSGIISGRLGRKRFGLEFPDEGFGDPDDYAQTIAHLKSPDRTRGFAAFYDQRVVTKPPETLSEGEFETTTKWSRTFDFNFATDENGLRVARYLRSAGSGTLTQTIANMLSPVVADADYVFEYTITYDDTPAGSNFTLQILAGFPSQAVLLAHNVGRHQVEFKSALVPSSFVIQGDAAASVPPAQIDIGNVTLKRKAPQIVRVPQRLNIVYKFADKLYLNDTYAGALDLILQGDGYFYDLTSRAKIVTRFDAVYIADAGNKPKIMRRLPDNSQRYEQRVRYKVIQCGIDYPQSDKDRCRVQFSTDATKRLQPGVYRFRAALENEFGDVSEPSLVSVELVVTANQFATVAMPAIPQVMPGSQVTKWRVYVSYHPGFIDDSVAPPTLVLTATEPTEYKYWKSIPTTDVSVEFTGSDMLGMTDHPAMPRGRGAPPKYRDFMILNDVGYGIAEVDSIRRESVLTEGTGTPLRPLVDPLANQFQFQTVRLDLTTVKDIPVDSTYLFISPPGEPQYAQHLIRFCSGDEIGVGLSHIGDSPVLLTNLGIIVYFPADRALKRTPSEVGCLSRDSIKRTERGVRFMGTDGVMRIFNGATVEEIADEVLPVFSKEDYAGYYKKFDRQFAHEASLESGNHKVFLSYPVSANPGNVPAKPEINSSPSHNLLVGDSSRGRTIWAIDSTGYEQLLWLGRESRMLAADFDGSFYAIEEGFADQGNGVPDRAPIFEMAARWFGTRRGMSRFYKVSIEIDTKGQDMTLVCRVDNLTEAVQEFTINTIGRQEVDRNLPAHFKGLYLEARILGATHATAGRPEVFDFRVESVPLGV